MKFIMISLIRSTIKKDQYFIITAISILAVFLWYINFTYWHNYFVYGVALIVYGTINSVWIGSILARYDIEKQLQFIFGLFLLIFLIAFGMALPIVFYKVGPLYLFGLLLFLTIAISLYSKSVSRRRISSLSLKVEGARTVFKIPKIVYIVGFAVYLFLLFLLIYSRTGEYIRSPWTVIHPLYLYGWFFIIFILGLSVFAKIKLKHFLFLVIISSLLLHAYLLIPYEAGFGGDKWRHIGAEQWLAQGNVYTPALFGEDVPYKRIGPIKVPEVFVVGNKTSYANMWGLVIAVSWLTGIDIFFIDLVLGMLLFSIFLPFLLLKIGSFFSHKKEFLYLFILMPFLFYPFVAYGSITMPLSFAFLLFLFSLIFLLRYYFQPSHSRRLLFLLIVFIPLLYFNYILYLVLFLEILLLIILIKNIAAARRIILPLFVICIILLLFFIPVLDTTNNFSWFKYPAPTIGEIITSFKDFSSRLFTSVAIFPRIYGFEQDNWLYATIDRHLSRSVLINILPWAFILTPFLWLVVIFGVKHYKKLSHPRLGLLFILLLVVTFMNQFIGSYFMEGNHIFSKRLVLMSSFLVFIPLSWGIYQAVKKLSNIFLRKAIVVAIVLVLSFTSVTVYASGPKFQVVTADEVIAAEYVWDDIGGDNLKYCVLANTWPLLALEGVSARHIVTGGFPYYFEYRQPERVQLFDNMNRSPSIRYLEKSLLITGARQCYFMTEKRWIEFNQREEVINQLDTLLGKHKSIGKVMVWLYKPNEVQLNN
ncbi:hypothetical protein MYX07_01580 [Patescibacteria group bacterium AH-259-L07]|nr:hypothetical protein [Patescibacteria group bacterium AH-259-L07]